MYCFTYANSLSCIFSNLLLWSQTTAEHPIFIKTVAELTNKNLPTKVIAQLMDLNKTFLELNTLTQCLKKPMCYNPYLPMQLKQLIDKFLISNTTMMDVVSEVKNYEKKDEVWQALLDHILSEQKYMHELFIDIQSQIY